MKHATGHPKIRGAQGVPLSTSDRERLRALIEREGETAVLSKLDIARQTLARCVAGLPVQRATADCVSRRLAALEGTDAG